ESKAGHVQIDFPRDLKVKRSYEQIILSFESSYLQDPSFHKTIDVPGKTELPDGSIISATYMDEMDIRADSRYTYVCAVEQVSFPLHIRTRQAGDRMTWKGLNGSKKIKDIFIDAKIPSHKRYSWPIVTDNNGKILWLVGLKKRDLKTSEKNETWIQLKYHQKGIRNGRFQCVHNDIEKVIITEEDIKKKCQEFGQQLTKEYEGKFPLAIGVLKGAMPFMSDLLKHVHTHLEMDFMDVSSYGGKSTRSTGEVKIVKDLDTKVEGRDLLIIEDIIDSGLTLSYLVDLLD